jgi:hypothetical protein
MLFVTLPSGAQTITRTDAGICSNKSIENNVKIIDQSFIYGIILAFT